MSKFLTKNKLSKLTQETDNLNWSVTGDGINNQTTTHTEKLCLDGFTAKFHQVLMKEINI